MLRIDRAKVLGKGGFGVVYEGDWGEIKVAIKRIPIEKAASTKQEEDALQTLNHDNIIKLFHVEEDLDFRCFVLELCNASLDQLFLNENDPKKYRGPMPPEEEVLLQLAKGLEHVHKNQLVHRDIKPENVLIWKNSEKDQTLMKWADFGLSKPVNERGTFSMTGVKGTTDWLAPEILKLMDEDPTNEEKKRGTILSDIFAEGLVFSYFLRGGVHPFGTSSLRIAVKLRSGEPFNLPEKEEYKSIILKMLEKEPEKRITSSAVVKLLTKIKNIFHMYNLFARSSLDDIEKQIQGLDVNWKDENGLTPLLHLTQIKDEIHDAAGIVKFLIQKGANVNHLDRERKNALILQCQNHKSQNCFVIIKVLIEQRISVNCTFSDGSNALIYLCQNYEKENLIDIIRLLIENGIEINLKDRYGSNALFYLCQNYKEENLIDIVRLLIENGIKINLKDRYGSNALLILCRFYKNKNLIDIIRLLIENGIEINCKDTYGPNALFYLCYNYKEENLIDIIRLLIENGIEINCKGRDETNELHILCGFYKNKNLIDIIRLLIENGIEINCKDRDERNELHILCQNYKEENLIDIIRLLIENGIEINCKDIDERNALLILCQNYKNKNLIDIIRLLIENGIEINCKDRDERNELHILCQNYKEENLIDIIRLLIENGMEINWKYYNNDDALLILCRCYEKENLIDIIRLLIAKRIEVTSRTFQYIADVYKGMYQQEILQLLNEYVNMNM